MLGAFLTILWLYHLTKQSHSHGDMNNNNKLVNNVKRWFAIYNIKKQEALRVHLYDRLHLKFVLKLFFVDIFKNRFDFFIIAISRMLVIENAAVCKWIGCSAVEVVMASRL